MDLGGQEQFRFLHKDFLKGTSIVIAVFDLSRYESLLDLTKWREVIKEIPNPCCVLVGNKLDLAAVVPDSEIVKIEEDWKTQCIMISTKTGENFQQLENALLDSLRKKKYEHSIERGE